MIKLVYLIPAFILWVILFIISLVFIGTQYLLKKTMAKLKKYVLIGHISLIPLILLVALIHIIYFTHEILFWVSVPFAWTMVKITPDTKNTIQNKLLNEIIKKRKGQITVTRNRPGR